MQTGHCGIVRGDDLTPQGGLCWRICWHRTLRATLRVTILEAPTVCAGSQIDRLLPAVSSRRTSVDRAPCVPFDRDPSPYCRSSGQLYLQVSPPESAISTHGRLIPAEDANPRVRKRRARMEIPRLGRAPRARRSQKPTGGPLLTNQRVERRRLLGFLMGRLYQGLKLPHRDETGAGGLCSVGAESARFQAPEAEDEARD